MKRLIVPVAVLALALAACSGENDGHGSHATPSAAPTTPADAFADKAFNGQDVMFAQSMVPHHQQALEMAALAETRAKNPKVKELAAQIKGAQDPEIKLMTGWLADWGFTVPSGTDHAGGHGGMLTADEMDKLGKSTGAAFDKLFLELMIKHHEGAVSAARTELAEGRFQPAKDLADAIIKGQTAEIATMKALLG